ncbi:hypothetical protein GF374_01220 [Candidatus Woesearchaeota archaeon]|nr:hypothetical protein [Candidatus Woesearchaeota archaeon]
MALKTRFCAKCGKETNKLIDSFCAECYFKEKGIKIPKKVSVQVCQHCGAIKWQGIWTKTDLPAEHYLTHILMSKIKLPEQIELEDIKLLKLGKKGEIELIISILGKKFKQKQKIDLEIRKGVCKDCSRQLAKTHKVKIQLRTEKNTEELIQEALEFSNKYRSNIIKVEEMKKGIDIYLSNREAGKHLAYDLRKKFHCKITETREQYGWDKSKNRPKTRITFLLKQS